MTTPTPSPSRDSDIPPLSALGNAWRQHMAAKSTHPADTSISEPRIDKAPEVAMPEPVRMIDDIAALIVRFKAWEAAGFPVEDPYDTYPNDLYDAATRPDAMLQVIAGFRTALAERDAARKGYADACKALSNAWAERDALRQELEALRASAEPVAEVAAKEPYLDGTPRGNELRWVGRNCEDDFPIGTKLYACPVQASAGPAETQGWISVEDRLPEVIHEDGGVNSVLVLFAKGKQPNGGSRWMVANTVWAGAHGKAREFTHWMPLPQPPGASPLPAPAREGLPLTCEWTLDSNPDDSIWQSACGEAWVFTDGGPDENGVRFCQGCGGRVRLVGIGSAKGDEHGG
jgi:hypothetical protein